MAGAQWGRQNEAVEAGTKSHEVVQASEELEDAVEGF